MPRNPHVRTVAICASRRQAETIAAKFDVGQASLVEGYGEDQAIVRVLPKGGQWHVESWDREALGWDRADLADNPLQGADVAFP